MIIYNSGVICRPATTCALCSSPGAVLYENLTDKLFGAPGEWRLCRCQNRACGLVWCDPFPETEEIGKLYKSYYTHVSPAHPAMPKGGVKSVIKRLLATVFFWRSPAFLTGNLHLEAFKPGRLLEVGCGTGAFLRSAKAAGWQAEGIDFDDNAVQIAKEHLGPGAVRAGELIECLFAAASFDAIVMSNVIEHIWNPVETVAECRRLLKPGGHLVMVTPNTNSDGHRAFGRSWRGLEPPRHLFIYNKPSLERLSKMTGFRKSLVFSSTGGSVGVDILRASAPSVPDQALRKMLRAESIKAALGMMSGEWCVAILTK